MQINAASREAGSQLRVCKQVMWGRALPPTQRNRNRNNPMVAKLTRKLAVRLLITVGGGLFGICDGSAHEWYPVECCGGNDRAEVEHATYDSARSADGALPILPVTTALGTGLVPSNFPRRESRDGKMHACMRPAEGDMRLICLFVPPPS